MFLVVAQKCRVEYTQEGNNENVICENKINGYFYDELIIKGRW